MLFYFGAVTVLFQRIGVPAGASTLPIAVPIGLAVGLYELSRKRATFRTGVLVVLGVFASVQLVLLLVRGGEWTSFALIAGIWCMLTLEWDQKLVHEFCLGVVGSMSIVSLLALVQLGLDLSGHRVIDPFLAVPSVFRMEGFNTTYQIRYDIDVFKPNGFVCLEPSFLSLLSAIALLLLSDGIGRAASRKLNTLMECALIAGMVASFAISGLVVLPFVVLVAFQNKRTNVLLTASVAFAVMILSTGSLFAALTDRVSGANDGSNAARLVRPYSELLFPFLRFGSTFFGTGPGSAQFAATMLSSDWTTEVTTPTAAKVTYEYGLLGLIVFGLTVGWVCFNARLSPWARLGLLAALVIPTDGLTSAVIAPVCILAMGATRDAVDGGYLKECGSERSKSDTSSLSRCTA